MQGLADDLWLVARVILALMQSFNHADTVALGNRACSGGDEFHGRALLCALCRGARKRHRARGSRRSIARLLLGTGDAA